MTKIITPIRPKPRHFKKGMRVQRVPISDLGVYFEFDKLLPEGTLGSIDEFDAGTRYKFHVAWDGYPDVKGSASYYRQCELIPVTETEEAPANSESAPAHGFKVGDRVEGANMLGIGVLGEVTNVDNSDEPEPAICVDGGSWCYTKDLRKIEDAPAESVTMADMATAGVNEIQRMAGELQDALGFPGASWNEMLGRVKDLLSERDDLRFLLNEARKDRDAARGGLVDLGADLAGAKRDLSDAEAKLAASEAKLARINAIQVVAEMVNSLPEGHDWTFHGLIASAMEEK